MHIGNEISISQGTQLVVIYYNDGHQIVHTDTTAQLQDNILAQRYGSPVKSDADTCVDAACPRSTSFTYKSQRVAGADHLRF